MANCNSCSKIDFVSARCLLSIWDKKQFLANSQVIFAVNTWNFLAGVNLQSTVSNPVGNGKISRIERGDVYPRYHTVAWAQNVPTSRRRKKRRRASARWRKRRKPK